MSKLRLPYTGVISAIVYSMKINALHICNINMENLYVAASRSQYWVDKQSVFQLSLAPLQFSEDWSTRLFKIVIQAKSFNMAIRESPY